MHWRIVAAFTLILSFDSFAAELDIVPLDPNGVRWSLPECSALISNATVHPLAGKTSKSGYIVTNTPAFQAYALRTTLECFSWINRALKLGGPEPLTCTNVTKFVAYPNYYGLHSSVVINKRFFLLIQNNRVNTFMDYDYFLSAFENRPQRLDELLSKPNRLNKNSAEEVARRAMAALGLTNGMNLQLREPPYVRQWETDSGPMPFFDVIWKNSAFKGSLDAIYGDAVSFEICGINTNVAHFHLTTLPSTNPTLRLPYATNFFDMLGMSATNRFWDGKWQTTKE